MTSVEKILAVLKHRKIPVSRMERDLGFGNGYIKQLKKGSVPAGRLMQICNYFDIPFSDMLPSDAPFDPADLGNKKTAAPKGDGQYIEDLELYKKFIRAEPWLKSQILALLEAAESAHAVPGGESTDK